MKGCKDLVCFQQVWGVKLTHVWMEAGKSHTSGLGGGGEGAYAESRSDCRNLEPRRGGEGGKEKSGRGTKANSTISVLTHLGAQRETMKKKIPLKKSLPNTTDA